MTHGVWQSLQPATVTRYLPRASFSALGFDALGIGACRSLRARRRGHSESDANGNCEHGVFERNAFHCKSLLTVGKMLVDPALDERDAFGIELLHT